MNRLIAALFGTGLILLAGCGEKEEFSRYPSLQIGAYSPDDYIQDLSDHNSEVVYNAVCNLGNHAPAFGQALSKEDVDPHAEEYKTAQAAYDGILNLLESRDPLVVAASLRFLQLFVRNCNTAAELIEPVCRINSSMPLVQFEQVELLGRLVDEETILPEQLLRRLLDSKSWIVSRSTYQLIGKTRDEPLRQELVKRYRAASDEKEKTVLLSALGAHAGPDEIALAKEEILSTDNPIIQSTAMGLLLEHLDAPGVLSWVVDHYPELNPEDEACEEMFELVCAVDGESKVEATRLLLGKGYVPDDTFLQNLNKRFAENSDELPAYLLGMENELLAVPEVASRWQALRQLSADNDRLYLASQEELEPLKAEFLAKVQVLLSKYGVPESDRQNLLKQISAIDLKATLGSIH